MILNLFLALMAFTCLVVFELRKAGILKGITEKNPWFILGCVILGVLWIEIIVFSFSFSEYMGISYISRTIVGAVLLIVTIVWYIYLLKGALPSEDIYSRDIKYRSTSYKGAYGRCRHPGFYAFILMSLSLSLICGSQTALMTALVTSIFNVIYIWLQDRVFFPIYLIGYDEYKGKVPFLAFWK